MTSPHGIDSERSPVSPSQIGLELIRREYEHVRHHISCLVGSHIDPKKYADVKQHFRKMVRVGITLIPRCLGGLMVDKIDSVRERIGRWTKRILLS